MRYLTLFPLLADVGWGRASLGDMLAMILLYWTFLLPASWIYHGSWSTLLGLCLVAIDVTAAAAIFRRSYRSFRHKSRVLRRIIILPLLFVSALPIPIINSIAALIVVRMLPGSIFP